MIQLCSHCSGLIEDKGVPVGEAGGASGPSVILYAHPEHAHLVERPDANGAALLARIRARRAGAA
ncbi:hypothetical protein OG937_29175 [Streptomyces sp. NBC_00510]